ncbi:MAG: BLUF domain-containing protein [Phycisphaeraceae bacterium]
MALSQWLYISDAVDPVCLDDLLRIQDVAMRNNARQNITGLLLHCEGRFVHFLEGDYASVSELYSRISTDDRHANITLLYDRPAGGRIFEEWHLAMLDLDLHGEAERSDLRAMVEYAGNSDADFEGQPRDLRILGRFADLLSSDGVTASDTGGLR